MVGVVSHAFSNTIPDATGQITVFNTQARTTTANATDLVRGADWNSAHVQGLTLSGNTAGVSTISGTNIVIQGGNNLTASGIQGVNAGTINFSAGADTVDQISISAGTVTGVFGSLVFSNSGPALNFANPISFSMSGSTISAYAVNVAAWAAIGNTTGNVNATNAPGSSVVISAVGNVSAGWSTLGPTQNTFIISVGPASINFSAGTTSNNLGSVVFSNGNGVSFGLNGSTVTGSHAVNLSAGTTSSNLSAVTFSNANNVSFGINGGTITASVSPPGGGNVISYFANFQNFTNTNDAVTLSVSTSHIVPFVLPQNLSASFIRVFATIDGTNGGQAAITTSNSTYSQGVSYNYFIGIYSQNTGASSASLSLLASSSGASILRYDASLGAAGTQFTITHAATYPLAGGTAGVSSTVAVSSASVRFLSNVLGPAFAGSIRGIDIPFASSFPASNLWLAIGASSTTGGNTFLEPAFFGATLYAQAGINTAFVPLGATVTNSSYLIKPGQGSFSSNAGGMPTAIAFSQISSSASHLMVPFFEMIRLA